MTRVFDAAFMKDGKLWRVTEGEFTPGDEIYDHQQGVFNVSTARYLIAMAAAKGYTKPVEEPLVPELVRYIAQCGIEEEHISRITPDRMEEPIIGLMGNWIDQTTQRVLAEETVLMIDGHHRIIKRARMFLPTFKMWIIPSSLRKYLELKVAPIPDDPDVVVRVARPRQAV